jgi:preprotein translocase subunit SecE
MESRKLMATVAESEALTTIKSWPERIKTFYHDVRTEMKKVNNPSFKEVQATTAVVIITVFLFGMYFFVVDKLIGTGIDSVFRHFAHH